MEWGVGLVGGVEWGRGAAQLQIDMQPEGCPVKLVMVQ